MLPWVVSYHPYLEERDIDADIEREAYDMRGLTEDYGDGNFEGDEVENYDDYES